MLSKLFTAFVATLIALLAGKEAKAAGTLLGYCTDNRNKCENKWEIYGNPSGDQTIQGHAKNVFNNKTEYVECRSFSSATSAKIKLCACGLCKKCDATLCNEAVRGQCTLSTYTGIYSSICSKDVK